MPTDADLRLELRALSSTYPRWMDRADFVLTQEFRRLVQRAADIAAIRRPSDLDRWRIDAGSALRDYSNLQRKVEAAAARCA